MRPGQVLDYAIFLSILEIDYIKHICIIVPFHIFRYILLI